MGGGDGKECEHLKGARNDVPFRVVARLKKSAEAISMVVMTKDMGAHNDNITAPPPVRAEVRGKAQFRSQSPTSHCSPLFQPTATTVPSGLSPTV